MARIELQILCICLTFICCLGAPLEQQLYPSELYRGGDGYFYFPSEAEMHIRNRAIDSLGGGHLLRAVDDYSKNPWRISASKGNGGGGHPDGGKRAGGGLDSLGRGNILRRASETEEFGRFLRAVDSLGGGNLLRKRRTSNEKEEI